MILALCLILFLLLLFIGGNRGLDSFFALIKIAILLIVAMYLISFGCNPFAILFIVSFLFLLFVLYIQNGWNIKMHAAAISVFFVLIFVWIIVGPILSSATMSGYNEMEQYEESTMYLSANLNLEMNEIVLATVLLGMLGAITDAAVAISTVVNEVFNHNPKLTKKELFLSGLKVGRDLIGTTINTLFFAGIGESIMLAIVFMNNKTSFAMLINSKALFQEVAVLFVSAIGCLFIFPVSSLVVATLLKINNQKSIKYFAYEILDFLKKKE